jgi:hypothetical protein
MMSASHAGMVAAQEQIAMRPASHAGMVAAQQQIAMRPSPRRCKRHTCHLLVLGQNWHDANISGGQL